MKYIKTICLVIIALAAIVAASTYAYSTYTTFNDRQKLDNAKKECLRKYQPGYLNTCMRDQGF
jgi:hypothetical protein